MPGTALKWDIAGSCNLACVHCGAAEVMGAGGSTPPSSALKQACRRIVRAGFGKVTLLGGEPCLLGGGLVRVVAHLASAGIEVSVTSNATLITSDLARALVDAGTGALIVSLEAGDEATCDAIRGRGAFRQALKGIEAYRAACERAGATPCLSVNTVVMRPNLHHIPAMLPLVSDLGVSSWNLFKLVPIGRARRNLDRLHVSEVELVEVGVGLAEACRDAERVPEIVPGFLYPLAADYIERCTSYALPTPGHCCEPGVGFYYMDTALRVFPCDRVRDQLADLSGVPCILDPDFRMHSARTATPFIGPLARIMRKSSYESLEPCSRCEYLWRGICLPCALVGRPDEPRVLQQCAAVLERCPELLDNHRPNRTISPYVRQFLRKGTSDVPSASLPRLDTGLPLRLGDEVLATWTEGCGILSSLASRELVVLDATQMATLSVLLRGATLAQGLSACGRLFSRTAAPSTRALARQLIGLGLCTQRPPRSPSASDAP